MSFNEFSRKVRNPLLSLSDRRSAFGSCLVRFAWLTDQRYSDVKKRFAPWLGSDSVSPHTMQEMLDALTMLEQERDRLLVVLLDYQRQRVREKADGKRVPERSQAQVLADVYQPRQLPFSQENEP